MLPEHPCARRSKGCKAATGRSPGLARSGTLSPYRTPHHSGATARDSHPPSLFSPAKAGGTWTLTSKKITLLRGAHYHAKGDVSNEDWKFTSLTQLSLPRACPMAPDAETNLSRFPDTTGLPRGAPLLKLKQQHSPTQDATGLSRGASRSPLLKTTRSRFRDATGLPRSLTLSTTETAAQPKMPRACPVEFHAHHY